MSVGDYWDCYPCLVRAPGWWGEENVRVFRKAGGDTPNGTFVPVGPYGDDVANVRVGPPEDFDEPRRCEDGPSAWAKAERDAAVTNNVDVDALLYRRGVPRRRYDWPSPKGGLATCRHDGNPLHALACRDCGAALNRPASRRFEMAPAFPWGVVTWAAILIATLAYALTAVSPEWAAALFQ